VPLDRPSRRRRAGWLLLALVALGLVNPYLRGDGNGYYAYLPSLVVDHDLDLTNQFQRGDPEFHKIYFDDHGRARDGLRTRRGYVEDQWGIGAAVMWAPAFLAAHAFVKLAAATGHTRWPADGYSFPYRWACAAATAAYAIAGLALAARAARRYTSSGGATLTAATLLLFAGSLVVYAFLLPFWSLALTLVPLAALLLRTRAGEVRRDAVVGWFVVNGALVGLAYTIHPLTAPWALLALAAVPPRPVRRALSAAGATLVGVLVGASPQLVVRAILYGNPFHPGYSVNERSKGFDVARVLFGANHGWFSWTPICLVAVVGVVLLAIQPATRRAGLVLLGVIVGSVLLASLSPFYEQSSFGNRFLLPTTPALVVGLAVVSERLRKRRGAVAPVAALLVIWNLGFVFQWAWGMIPKRGPVNFARVARNQVGQVPGEFGSAVRLFLTDRPALVRRVQQVDSDRIARHEG
jgi:hypothetical protein